MAALLDVNVLIALAWPNHVHHRVARLWFGRRAADGWATCPLTQSGFVRVSSNRKVIGDAKTPAEARQLLRRIVALPGHEFWPDDIAIADSDLIDDTVVVGYRQITDAHLLALAIRRSGRLATLDRGLRDLVPRRLEADHVLELLV